MKHTIFFAFCWFSLWAYGQTFIEDFEDINNFNDWYFQNNSAEPGLSWQQGDTLNFDAHQGSESSFLGAGYQSSASLDPLTLSNWAVAPSRTFNNGDIITFYSRRKDFTPVFPDRLEVRLSTAGNSINTGFLAEDIGDFTTLLLSINPDLTSTGYPEIWTQFTIIISGLTEPTNGRLAFRYFVTDGGPGGSNSNYIGIDSFTYYSSLSPPANDACENAIHIDHATACIPESGTLQAATESLVGCSGTANNDVWYQFTANSNAASIEVVGSSEMDAVVEIYSGSCSNLNLLNCVNSSFDGETESAIVSNLITGQTYFLRIYDWYNWVPNTMDFTLCIEAFEQCAINPGMNSSTENESCGTNENGGCFAAAPVYQDVECYEAIYGSSYVENGIKDYDWYRFSINEPGELNIVVHSEFPVNIEVYNISNCNVPFIVANAGFNSCEPFTLSSDILSGTYAAVVSPTSNNPLQCGELNHYEISFELPLSNVDITPSTGMMELCEGQGMFISCNQTGGAFSWVLENQVVSEADSLYLDTEGTLFLNYTNTNGCVGNYSDTLDLTVLPMNEADFNYGSSVLCIGDGSITNENIELGIYTASTGLYIDSLNGAINTNLSESGSYTIVHQTEGACPDTSELEITIGSYTEVNFELGMDIICDTAVNITLSGTPAGGVFYGPGVSMTEFSASDAGLGTHELTYSYDNAGCQSDVFQEITVENCSWIQELNTVTAAWPNPFRSMLNIETPIHTKYSIYNALGQLISTGETETNHKIVLDLGYLRKGIYQLQLEGEDFVNFVSLIKE